MVASRSSSRHFDSAEALSNASSGLGCYTNTPVSFLKYNASQPSSYQNLYFLGFTPLLSVSKRTANKETDGQMIPRPKKMDDFLHFGPGHFQPEQTARLSHFHVMQISYTPVANKDCRLINHIITSEDMCILMCFPKSDMSTVGGLPGLKEVAEWCPVPGNNKSTGKGVFCRNEQGGKKGK